MVGCYGVSMEASTQAEVGSEQETINYTSAAALRHAADCVEELKEKGEPMGPRQTFRRGYNAADDYLVNSALTAGAFDDAVDTVGDVVTMALDHDIDGTDAATFYRNQADALEA